LLRLILVLSSYEEILAQYKKSQPLLKKKKMESEPSPQESSSSSPKDKDNDNLTPEEKEEADMGAAVAKVGIFALIIGLFFNIMRMLRGNRKSKTN